MFQIVWGVQDMGARGARHGCEKVWGVQDIGARSTRVTRHGCERCKIRSGLAAIHGFGALIRATWWNFHYLTFTACIRRMGEGNNFSLFVGPQGYPGLWSQVPFPASGPMAFLLGYPSPRFFPRSLVPGPFSGVPKSPGGYLRWGVPPPPGDRTTERVLATRRAVKCLLRSRRRTCLFCFEMKFKET